MESIHSCLQQLVILEAAVLTPRGMINLLQVRCISVPLRKELRCFLEGLLLIISLIFQCWWTSKGSHSERVDQSGLIRIDKLAGMGSIESLHCKN